MSKFSRVLVRNDKLTADYIRSMDEVRKLLSNATSMFLTRKVTEALKEGQIIDGAPYNLPHLTFIPVRQIRTSHLFKGAIAA